MIGRQRDRFQAPDLPLTPRTRQTWRRHDISELRIGRLVQDVTREAAFHPDGSPVATELGRAVVALLAAVEATRTTPAVSETSAGVEEVRRGSDEPA